MSPAPTCTAPCCATSAGATASGGSTGRSTSIKRSSTIDRAGAMTSGSWRGSAVLLLVAPLVGAALVAPTRESVLYVSNEVSNSITVISPRSVGAIATIAVGRSEEHTSELQSRLHLVCRLLLEKKKNNHMKQTRN